MTNEKLKQLGDLEEGSCKAVLRNTITGDIRYTIGMYSSQYDLVFLCYRPTEEIIGYIQGDK